MVDEWQAVTVGEFAPLAYGKSLPERARNELGRIPVFGSSGIVGFHDVALTQGPTVVVGRKGTVGVVYYSPCPCWPIDTTFYVDGDDALLVRYIYFALKSIGLDGMNGDSAVPGLNRDAAHARRLMVPASLQTRRAIAHILGTLDDKIELNRRMNETLEAIAQAIFKSWFVDFDPVRAKASGEPEEEICRRLKLTPDILALFPDRLVESELGQIPAGWEVLSVGAVAESIFSGGTPDTRIPTYWGGEFSWFSSGETRNRYVVETEKTITQAGIDNSSTRLAVPGDILIASAGQGWTRGQTSYCAISTYVNQSVVCVRARPTAMHSLWLFYNLARRYDEMRSISDSHSSRGSLTTKLIAGMPILYPGARLALLFGNLAAPTADRQVANQRESITLAATRDALLPELLSGSLRVPVED